MSTEKDSGIAALRSGDIATAIATLESATRSAPGDYDAHVHLASAYSRANRINDAVTALTQAVTIQPNNAKARFNLGVAYERAGRADYAATVFQQALDIQPNYPEALHAIQRVRPASVQAVAQMQPAWSPLAAAAPVSAASPLTGPSALAGASPLTGAQPLGGAPPAAGIPGLYPTAAPVYNTPPQPQFSAMPHSGTGLGQPLSSAKRLEVPDENIPMGLLAGVVLTIVLGLGFAYASMAAGFRIPYLTLAIGWLMAKGVCAAARETGYAQGIIAAVGTAIAGAGGLLIMNMNGLWISPFAYVIVVFAVATAWKVASDAD